MNRQISRRDILLGGAAIGLAGALGAARLVIPAGARVGASDALAAGIRGLVGATIGAANYSGTDETQASNKFDQLVGRPMARKVQKIYYQEGDWPSSIPQKDLEIIQDLGAKLLISFKPFRTPPSVFASEKANLEAAIDMYQAAGATFDVTLWQEPNDGRSFGSGDAYKQYVSTYGPTVHTAGAPLVYDPGSGLRPGESPTQLYQSWHDYYPGDALIDKIVVDYYGSAWNKNVRLDEIEDIADSANPPKSFGIGEWNDDAVSTGTLGTGLFKDYVQYLIDLFTMRLNLGKTNGDIIFWMGDNAVDLPADQILSSSDFKIPFVQMLYDRLS